MKKILLAVNCEYGQANVFLAAGHALQAADPDVEIHFASFAPISGDVSTASAYSTECTPGAQPWTFHLLDGPGFEQAIAGMGIDGELKKAFLRHPTFFGTTDTLGWLIRILLPWNGPEFVRVYQSFRRVVEEVQPDMIAVDSLFSPALTACRHLALKHLVLSPNTLKDFGVALQPWGAMFWKFPAMCSAFPFPVPWRFIPANIFYCLCHIYYVLTDTTSKATKAYVKRELGANLITFESLMFRPLPGQKILVASRPEIDFPLVVPRHLTPCGPVLRPVPPVAAVDPELDAWLRRGPTVFISLGTLKPMAEDEALEMTRAVKQLLEEAGGRGGDDIEGVPGRLQVLWKLKKDKNSTYETGPGTRIYSLLGNAVECDRVRIVDWVKPQPSGLLQMGTVVCSVNHGGANSFHDALTSGVPQVVLPTWFDCYDFASRAEVLGIGRWGNQQAMPQCKDSELGPILVDVVFGPRSQSMRARVRELAALCAETPGASVAATAILEEMDDRKTK